MHLAAASIELLQCSLRIDYEMLAVHREDHNMDEMVISDDEKL